MKTLILSLALVCITTLSQASSISLSECTPSSFVQDFNQQCSVTGDINGDGRLDLIMSGTVFGTGFTSIVVYLGDAVDTFIVSTNSGLNKGVHHGWLDLGDQDDDGDLDLVIQGWYHPDGATNQQIAIVYNNNGSGVFTETYALSVPGSNGTIVWGDYDNDDDLDLVQVGFDNTAKAGIGNLYTNNGDNTFTVISDEIDNIADASAKWGDYDNDGKLDLLMAGWNRVKVLKGDGAGNFTTVFGPLAQNYDFTDCNWVDFDKDSKLDFVLAGKAVGVDPAEWATMVFKGDGLGGFVDLNLGVVGVQKGPIAVADLDNDSYNDVVVSGWAGSGQFKVYQNDQNNTSMTDVTASLGVTIGGWADGTLQVADFNNDGFLEVFKCGWRQTKLYTTKDLATKLTMEPSQTLDFYVNTSNQLILNTPIDNDAQLKVYDISGKRIFASVIQKGSTNVIINHLKSGLYIVDVESVGVQKIVIQ